MYDERHEEFDATIRGLHKNLIDGTIFNSSNTLVVIIADGIEKLTDPRQNSRDNFLQYLTDKANLYESDFGRFFSQIPSSKSGDLKSTNPKSKEYSLAFEAYLKTTKSHLFFESHAEVKNSMQSSLNSESSKPILKVLFVIKDRNKRKLHSHFLFVMGICPHFEKLERLMFLDIGTKPAKNSVVKMLSYLTDNVYGVCGHLIINKRLEMQDFVGNFQKIDFIMLQTMMRGYESLTNTIQCLPGAYSAYSIKMLSEVSSETELTPFKVYFKHFAEYNVSKDWKENITHRISEDRVLVGEIYNYGFKAKYVSQAVAYVDHVPNLSGLILQRKRWFTGSLFASVYYSSKNFGSKLFLLLSACMWALSPAYFQIMLDLLIYNFKNFLCDTSMTSICNDVVYNLPLANILVVSITCIIALSASADQVKWYWRVVCWYYSLLAILMVYIAFALSANDIFVMQRLWIGIVCIIGLHVLAVLLSEDRFSLIALVHYFMMLPTYINVIIVYSMCRTDDFSWGNRNFSEHIEILFSKKKAWFLQCYVTITAFLVMFCSQ